MINDKDKLAKEHQERLDALMLLPSEEPPDYQDGEIIDYDKEMRSNGHISFQKFAKER